jgi:hypothetical protein
VRIEKERTHFLDLPRLARDFPDEIATK